MALTLDPEGRDPVTGAAFLSELYEASDPSSSGRWTVPVLYDTKTRRIVSNDYPQISLDLSTEWWPLQGPGAPDLYPEDRQGEIDVLNEILYAEVNNGVYRCGFATDQAAYERACRLLFDRLDLLSRRLETQRYLFRERITESDVRLFTTLVRFDAVYHGHTWCHL